MYLFRRYFALVCVLALSAGVWAKSRVEIAAENTPAVVTVNVMHTDGTTYDASGFIVAPDGVIVTTRHALEQAAHANITSHNGIVSGPAHVLGISQETDLILLKIPARNLPTVTFADSDYVLPGQEITVIGSPRRLQNSVSSGIISQVRQAKNGQTLHQISAPISPSSSGSPVFNEQGYVISVVFSSYKGENNQNLNFSIPSNYVLDLLRQHNYEPKMPAPPQQKTSYWDKVISYWSNVWHRLWK